MDKIQIVGKQSVQNVHLMYQIHQVKNPSQDVFVQVKIIVRYQIPKYLIVIKAVYNPPKITLIVINQINLTFRVIMFQKTILEIKVDHRGKVLNLDLF